MEIRFDWMGFFTAIVILCIATIVIALYIIAVSMAKKRGRSKFFWFIFSLLFSPILAMIFLLLLGETENKRFSKTIQYKDYFYSDKNDLMKCSQCAELIRIESNICRYCGFSNSKSSVELNYKNSFEEWKKNNPNGNINDYFRK